MFRDYLRSFWRGILNNKVATLINVGGLALGFAVFFALTFYVYREFSWDAHWEDADRIFVTAAVQESDAGISQFGNGGPYVLGASMTSRYSEALAAYARVYFHTGTPILSVGGNEYPFVPRHHAEPSLFDIIQFELLEGSFDEAFANPGGIAINAVAAERYFGDASPLGVTVTFKQPESARGTSLPPRDFVIRAVYRVPEPSNFATMQFLALLDPETTPPPGQRTDLWQFQPPQPPPQPGAPFTVEQPFNVEHFFKLRDGVDAQAMESDLRTYMDANRLMDTGTRKTRFLFRNVQDMHLAQSPLQVGDNVQRLWVYAAIGVLVLLISGCNFVLLATLRLVDRMREVGIRKSAGGGSGQLMYQYLLDAFLHTLVAALLAVLFLAYAFPKLAAMLQLPLQVQLLTPRNLALSLMMVLLFTLVSSSYPAWLVSQTKPGPLLRNGAGAVVGTGTTLRKLLVGLQFAIVVVLLLASAVVRQQIDYTTTRDRGYRLENVISLRTQGFDMARTPALVAEFGKVSGVEAVTGSVMMPGLVSVGAPTPVKAFAEDGSTREAGLQQRGTGTDFFKVMSISILAGREFSNDLDGSGLGVAGTAPPQNVNVVLNASAARLLGFTSPEAAVEQLLELETATMDRQVRKQNLRVIGVVADTQFSSVMMPPVPEFYMLTPQAFFIAAKLAPGADRAAVIEDMEAVWDQAVNGTTPFTLQDMGAAGSFQLQREEFEARIITYSTGLAIVIALLGLYGLVAATVVKRVKEIGVRKVMGAERTSIVTLFLFQFSKPIVVANVLAWPFGFWAIRQWLTRFPYQLDTVVIVMSGLAASIVALLIAWLTVGAMAARAASVNPVKALRYE